MTSYAGWRDDYKARLRSADDAMQLIEDGDLVGLTILAPPALAVALLKRGKALERMDLRLLSPHILSLVGPDAPNGEKEIELFIGDAFRPSHDARITTYLPNTFMLFLKAFDAGREEARIPDVFLTVCSPPNEQGF